MSEQPAVSLRFLHLEDDDLDAALIAAELRESFPAATIVRARNRAEFVAALDQRFDLMLSDYSLPSFDGFAALALARQRFPEMPFIVVSGAVGEDRAIEALRAGLTDYVLKNALNRLVPAVRRALNEAAIRHERRRTLESLRDSEARFRQLANAMPHIVWAARPDGYVDYYNQRWYEYTGLPVEQFGDPSWLPVVHPDDLVHSRKAWDAALKSGDPFEVEHRLHDREGHYHWHLSRALPARDHRDRIVRWFGSSTDIDDLKRAQQEASEASAAKDRFLAALSHELRTPLNPVLLAVENLCRDHHVPQHLQKDLTMIRGNIELEARLIDDLLDLTRIARGRFEIRAEPVDVHALLRHAIATCYPTDMQPKHLHLDVHLDAAEHYVQGDPTRLEQVFWNLLKNAAKFTPAHGTITLRTGNEGASGGVEGSRGPAALGVEDGSRTRSTSTPRPLDPSTPSRDPSTPRPLDPSTPALVIRVADTGIGIAPEYLDRIFKAFEQAPGGMHLPAPGLGLGLAIARAIVHRHGGSIVATSPGTKRGATFTVKLDTVSAPAAAPAGGGGGTLKADAPGRPLRILLVEDHADTAHIMARLLRAHGHSVAMATTVQEALSLADAEQFDFLVSDLGLPDGSGHDLVRALRAKRPLPAVALSGYGMESDVQASLAAGFQAHLTKPIHFPSLLGLLGTLAVAR